MKKITVASFIILATALSGGYESHAFIRNKNSAQSTEKKSNFKEKFNAWKQNAKNKFDYKVLKRSSNLQNEFTKEGSVDLVALKNEINKTLPEIVNTLKSKEVFFTERGLTGEYRFVIDALVKLTKSSEKLLTILKNGQYKKLMDFDTELAELEGRSYGCYMFMSTLMHRLGDDNPSEGFIAIFDKHEKAFAQLANQVNEYESDYDLAKALFRIERIFRNFFSASLEQF